MNNDIPIDNFLPFKQDREISWLRFNRRILEEADDPGIPLLERLKFVSIYATNLDEFFMIRVGSLYDKSLYAPDSLDNKSGQTPGEQLTNVYKTVRSMNMDYNNSYLSIISELKQRDIIHLEIKDLGSSGVNHIRKYFFDTIYPILSPQIVDPHHPFPHLKNKGIYIACLMKHKDKNILGIIPVPEKLPPLLYLPGKATSYIHVEKIIMEFADTIFESYKMIEKTCLSVTRNADITPDDEVFENKDDFRKIMKKLLHIRKSLAVVRLECCTKISISFSDYLCKQLGIADNQIYVTKSPLNMEYVQGLIKQLDPKKEEGLLYPPFEPVLHPIFIKGNLINLVKGQDFLFHYPYDSMKPFLQMMKRASHDSSVVSIKITIYRLAMRAALVDYLCRAAENGIDVTVLIELRARFDEQNNIDWSQRLEDAGCKIIYGFEEFKTHSKVCLITYKDKGKIKFITQIGTGNYNEKTAELYTDLSLITHNQEIGKDAADLFMNMSIGNLEGQYKHLLVAPFNMKIRLLNLIDEEIAKGPQGRILFKLNSITDIDMINKLSEASCAGVTITLIVRGICCILPGVPGRTENIRVVSIVGRFLEHSRIYSFGSGTNQKLFISSADLMTRNLNRRIEVACPILDPEVKREINEIIETSLYDNVKARILGSDGNYRRYENNRISISSQDLFMEQAAARKIKRLIRSAGFFRIFRYPINKSKTAGGK